MKKKPSARIIRKAPLRVTRQGVNFRKNVQAERQIQKGKRKGTLKKTRHLIKWLMILVVLPGALLIGGLKGYKAYQQSSWLALRTIEVSGNKNLPREKILERLGIELGVHLFPFTTRLYELKLDSLAWIENAKVTRSFPNKLKIQITEREPIAMACNNHWVGLSTEGIILPDLRHNAFDLPIVDHLSLLDSTQRSYLGGFLGSVQGKYPSLFANFSQVKVVSSREAEIVLKDGRQKILVALGDKSLNSLEFLQALTHQQGNRLEDAKTIDLRVEGFAYVH